MYRNYYSMNVMPQMPPKDKPDNNNKPQKPDKCKKPESISKPTGILGKLETDDIILIAIILILLYDECDDKLLLAAIAFVFISGIT